MNNSIKGRSKLTTALNVCKWLLFGFAVLGFFGLWAIEIVRKRGKDGGKS